MLGEEELRGRCGGCASWNFKVDAGQGAWGDCLNPKVLAAVHIATAHAFNNAALKLETWQIPILHQEVRSYARVDFSERDFGCIYYEPREAKGKIGAEVIEKTVYICPMCKTEFAERADAERCLAQGFHPNFEVGDVVLAGGLRFGWYDGDAAWIHRAEESRCATDSGLIHEIYYVVTLVDSDPGRPSEHRPRYHLWTKAFKGGKGYAQGYTFDEHHFLPHKVANPPALIVADSKDLLGKAANHLL